MKRKKCNVIAFAVPGDDRAFGASVDDKAFSASRAQLQCIAHAWSFPEGEVMHEGKECPIGRIERATDEAIAQIERAKSGQEEGA